MSQQVKIKVKVGQVVHFPGLCVHCANPAGEPMPLRKRIGRVTRLVNVPVCADCARELRRLSGEEERLRRLGYAASGLALLLVWAVAALLLPALPLLLRLGLALGAGALAAAAVHTIFQRLSLRAARPEKQAILQSARLANFSWRATTFEFANETFAGRFIDLNQSILMELST